MLLILHDLETQKVNNRKEAELIQIGAVKVQLEDGNFAVLDTFDRYVKPKKPISAVTTQFTGISESDIAGAESFPLVLDAFKNWIGAEDFYFCSWSLSDRDIFIDECVRHKLGKEWIRNYNDIQLMFVKKFRHLRRIGLFAALASQGIEPSGKQHNALADTMNTLELLVKIYDASDSLFAFEKNEFIDGVRNEMVYSDGAFENNPFAKLKSMIG